MRAGPRLERTQCPTLQAAIERLQEHLDELAPASRRQALQLFRRRFEPSSQVAVRAEIAAPGRLPSRARAGIDLHGDGSLSPYRGRLRRAAIELRDGESPYQGLARALSAPAR